MEILKRVDFGSVREKVFFAAFAAMSLFFAVLDQWTKWLVTVKIPGRASIEVIPGLFNLTYVTNPGAAWGILAGRGWMLTLISVVVFVLILLFMRTLTEGWPERYFAFFLVLGGIVGNSIDRISRGSVVDFLDFHIGTSHWPAFNVADSCITVGVAVFIASSLFRKSSRKAGFLPF